MTQETYKFVKKQALKEMEKAEDLKWVGVAKEKYEQDYKKEKDLEILQKKTI